MTAVIRSVKLTEGLRDQLLQQLTKDKYVKEWDKIFEESAELTRRFYSLFREENGLLDQFSKLPAGWLPESNAIKVKVSGVKYKLHFNGYSRCLPWRHIKGIKEEKRPFRQIDLYSEVQVGVPRTHELGSDLSDLILRAQKLEKEEKDLRNEIIGVLCSVTTTGRLCQVWPEIEPLVKKTLPREVQANQLPARVLTNLNAKLNLKVA